MQLSQIQWTYWGTVQWCSEMTAMINTDQEAELEPPRVPVWRVFSFSMSTSSHGESSCPPVSWMGKLGFSGTFSASDLLTNESASSVDTGSSPGGPGVLFSMIAPKSNELLLRFKLVTPMDSTFPTNIMAVAGHIQDTHSPINKSDLLGPNIKKCKWKVGTNIQICKVQHDRRFKLKPYYTIYMHM